MASSAAAGFLGRGSSGNNSNMRGLVQFIADLRNARARELEEKRINKELANIRSVKLSHKLHRDLQQSMDYGSSAMTDFCLVEYRQKFKGLSIHIELNSKVFCLD